MQATTPLLRPGRSPLLPCLLTALTLLATALLLWPTLARTAPPPEVAIELSADQLTALTDAYENGLPNPDPDDPCDRLQLLTYKSFGKWKRQFSRRGCSGRAWQLFHRRFH